MLYWETVSGNLRDILLDLMSDSYFDQFRLVGGTALSLHFGHRLSVDIDLFTDAEYGTLDFDAIEALLKKKFPVVKGQFGGIPGFGKSYQVGSDEDNLVKLDLYYCTEPFLTVAVFEDNVRLASPEDIAAMKIEVIQRGGRKKDFWDIHELLDTYSVNEMVELHKRRYPWTHDREALMKNFTDFSVADDEFEPQCLKGKIWEFIKEDLIDAMKKG